MNCYGPALCINNTVKTLQCQASVCVPTSEEPGVAEIFILIGLGRHFLLEAYC
jgi:anti-anti-sigma regulatory factor